MNQELEDLMLEYLLRKKLNQDVKSKMVVKTPETPRSRKKVRRNPIHKWSQQDFNKVAFMTKQGYEPQAIAKDMGLRTQQIRSAIIAMQGKNPDWNAPRLLVGQS